MNTLTTIAMFALSLSASAGTINISDYGDSNDYWQVQSATGYETICEGSLETCEAPAGFYHVINLTTGDRTNNVSVAESASGVASHDHYTKTLRGLAENSPVPFIMFGDCGSGEKAIAVNCVAVDYREVMHPVNVLINDDELGASCQPNYDFEGAVTMQISCTSGH